jgi:hypothetical protein
MLKKLFGAHMIAVFALHLFLARIFFLIVEEIIAVKPHLFNFLQY